MKSIYKCSEYGFLKIENIYYIDRVNIELAALCVKGVYAATLTIDEGKLHVIFNPEETSLYQVNDAIAIVTHNIIIAHKTRLNEKGN